MADVNNMILEKGYNYTMNAWDGFLYTPSGTDLIARCDALSESAFNIATEMQEKRAGPENAIIFSIPSNKTVTAALTNLAFDETWLSLQTGERLRSGKFTIYGRSAQVPVTDNSGVRTITLPEVPTGQYISIASGSGYVRVNLDANPTATVDVTSVTGINDTCLNVVYAAVVESKQLDIGGSTPPSVVMLVLKKKIRKGKGGDVVGNITITLPNFQPDGNLEFAGTLGDSDTMTLNGTAQAAASTECGGAEQALGSINIEDIGEGTIRVVAISVASSFEVATGGIDNIQVWASRGAELVYEPFDVTEECEFVSEDEDYVTVDSTGEIMGVQETTTPIEITITYQNLTITTEVTVVD